jgi:PAS domain S-box-containing protein
MEREWVEGALRLSEEKFAKAFANNQAAVSINRLTDGVFLEVNDTCVELSGYSREEMIGHSSRRMMWPTRDACARCLRKLREKGSVRGWEQEFLRKSGEVIVTELSAQIWILNGKKLVVTTLVDITARKRAEKALRRSESQFRAFFETEAVGTVEVDLNGRFIQVNQRYCQITGYSREELLGMSLVDLVHPEDRDAARPYFQGRVPILDTEKRYIRKDRSVIWVHVTAAMIRDGEGNLLRSAGVIQDITERKQAEKAMLRAEKLAATGRMAAAIAHEVNNPLAGAMNALYLASTDSGLKPNTKEYLTLADQELRRASHITQQTLGFYRASGSRTPTALPKLIDEVLDVYVTKLHNRNITVHRRYRFGRCAEGDDECFLVNGSEMRQILSNLLANGIDALNDNGMLYIRALRTNSLNESGPNLHLTIADNGCGVRQEHLRRIFEPFFTTKESFGTGLGLWVTQELVRKHNGSIKVRSREGKGTVFRITFPAMPLSGTKQDVLVAA